MHRVERRLDLAARGLQRRLVGVARDADEIADDDRAAPERHAKAGAIP